jgi:hypothetical protein
VIEWHPHFVCEQKDPLGVLLAFALNSWRPEAAVTIPGALTPAASSGTTDWRGPIRPWRGEEVRTESDLARELAQLPVESPRSSKIRKLLGRKRWRIRQAEPKNQAKKSLSTRHRFSVLQSAVHSAARSKVRLGRV